jgi:hypothetical protein
MKFITVFILVFNGNNTVCTVSAPHTGVGGGGAIDIVFTYPGNGKSPLLANSISAGSSLVTFSLNGTPGTQTLVIPIQN